MKMIQKAIGTFALALGMSMFAAGSLSAQQGVVSEKVSIPFAFHVAKVSLPAGEYRIEQVFGKEIVALANMQTRQTVQLLRSEGGRTAGKAKLTFEVGPRGYALRKLSKGRSWPRCQ